MRADTQLCEREAWIRTKLGGPEPLFWLLQRDWRAYSTETL
jgi:hypothetical protein